MAPKYFWVTLLVDALAFLCINEEQSEIYFSSAQTFELMHCLEVLNIIKDILNEYIDCKLCFNFAIIGKLFLFRNWFRKSTYPRSSSCYSMIRKNESA